jgi:Protein of unknown function (DUF1761)
MPVPHYFAIVITLRDVDLNYWAVVVAALVPIALGALWYSTLFRDAWLAALGKRVEELGGSAGFGYFVAVVAAFVMSYTLARVVHWADADDFVSGALAGLLAWVGFVATTSAVNGIFAGRSRNLYLIDAGYHLVSLVLMGAILGAWF